MTILSKTWHGKILLALLLSNQNKSLKVIKQNLDVDERDYTIQIDTELASGDFIISVRKKNGTAK